MQNTARQDLFFPIANVMENIIVSIETMLQQLFSGYNWYII